MELRNKTVLVTGASGGIGRAIALECGKNEAVVIVHFRKNESGAEETLKEIQKYSSGKIVQADLTKEADIERMFSDIKTADLLVNNAGEYQPGKFEDTELWLSQWQNIFLSMVNVTNRFLKTPSPAEIRKIINISSIYGTPNTSKSGGPQYSAAKAAVNSWTCTLAKKLSPQTLVNAVSPGYTWTPSWEGTSKEEMKVYENLSKIGRYVQPIEIATMVIELLKNDAMTGEIIRVDGGVHLQNDF